MAYTDCAGTEHQFGTCVGFSYPPYVPPLYCSNSTLAGVKCLGNVELFFILTCINTSLAGRKIILSWRYV